MRVFLIFLVAFVSVFWYFHDTSVDIAAPPVPLPKDIKPEQVWNALIDFKNYNKWNTYMVHSTASKSKIQIGDIIQVTVENAKLATNHPLLRKLMSPLIDVTVPLLVTEYEEGFDKLLTKWFNHG